MVVYKNEYLMKALYFIKIIVPPEYTAGHHISPKSITKNFVLSVVISLTFNSNKSKREKCMSGSVPAYLKLRSE